MTRMKVLVWMTIWVFAIFSSVSGQLDTDSTPSQNDTNVINTDTGDDNPRGQTTRDHNATRNAIPIQGDVRPVAQPYSKGDRGFASDGTLYGTYGTGYRSYSNEYDGYRGYGDYGDGKSYPGSRSAVGYDYYGPRYAYYTYPYYPTYRREYSGYDNEKSSNRYPIYSRGYSGYDGAKSSGSYPSTPSYRRDYSGYDTGKSSGSNRAYVSDGGDYYRRYYGNRRAYADYNDGDDYDYRRYDYRTSYLGYPRYDKGYNQVADVPKTTFNYGRAYLGYASRGQNNGDYNGNGYWRISPKYDDTDNYYRYSGYRRPVGYVNRGTGKSW